MRVSKKENRLSFRHVKQRETSHSYYGDLAMADFQLAAADLRLLRAANVVSLFVRNDDCSLTI